MFSKTLIAGALAGLAAAQADIDMTSIGSFKMKHPAFIKMTQFKDSEDFLLVSQFSANGSGHVYVIPDVKDATKNNDVSGLEPVKLDTGK